MSARALTALAGVVAVIIYASMPGNPPTPARQAERATYDLKLSACVLAERAVTDRLKAPSTAKFPWGCSDRVVIDAWEVRVHGYVDAQNGFGAMLRSQWTVVYARAPGASDGLSLRSVAIQ